MRGSVIKVLVAVALWAGGLSPAYSEPVLCATVTSSVPIYDWRPRTPLERVYYASSVCWRQKALDNLALAHSATVSLAARTPERLSAELPETAPAGSNTLMYVGIAGGATALGFVAGVVTILLTRH